MPLLIENGVRKQVSDSQLLGIVSDILVDIDPNRKPSFIGQKWTNFTTGRKFVSKGTSSVEDWAEIAIDRDVVAMANAIVSTQNELLEVRNSLNLHEVSSNPHPTYVKKVGPNPGDLKTALEEAIDGMTLVLYPKANYVAVNPTDFHFDKELQIEGNNSSISCSNPSTFWAGYRALMRYRNVLLDTGILTTPINVVENQVNFTFPNDWEYEPSVGDKVLFTSNNNWSGNDRYNHGMVSVIVKVTNRTALLSLPFYTNFAVNKVVVYKKGSCKIKDINFDMTNVPTGLDYVSHGLIIEGATNPELNSITCTGNDNSHVGIGVYNGEGGWAINCNAYSFWNAAGVTGGGRLGYGINSVQNNFTIQGGTFWRCKHATVQGASKDLKVIAGTVRDTTVYEDPADLSTSVGGSLDAHANYLGRPTFLNNTIYCLKNAFNVRGGAGLIQGNTVFRITNDTSPLVSTVGDSVYNGLKIVSNIVKHPVGAPIIARTWATTESCGRVEVIKNEISGGGTLVSMSQINASLNGWRFEGNEIESGGNTNVIDIQFLQNGRLRDAKINDNTISTAATTCISLMATSLTIAKQPRLENVEIKRNNINLTSTTASPFITIQYMGGSNVMIDNNDPTHTTEANSINVLSSSLNSLKVTRNRTVNGILRIGQAGVTGSADTYENCEIVGNSIIGVNAALVVQEQAEDIVFTGATRINSNSCRLSNSVRAVVWTNRTGSTAWPASNEVEFSNNNLNTASTVACVQINANSVGQKILFRNNILSAPIEDLSNTHYGIPIGNTHRTGTQNWRGGTQFRSIDSTLRASAAPTTGTWSLSDIVWNSNPSNAVGQPVGWLCVAGGSPGTWRPFGVTA